MINNTTKTSKAYYLEPLSELNKAKKLATESYDKYALMVMSKDLIKFSEADAKTRFEETKRLIEKLIEFLNNKKSVLFMLQDKTDTPKGFIEQCAHTIKIKKLSKFIANTEEVLNIMYEMLRREGTDLGIDYYINLWL